MNDLNEFRHFETAKQELMDLLLEKNHAGKLSPEERETLQELVAEAENLMVENAKSLKTLTDNDRSASVGTTAIPVTVWIKPSASAN